MYYVLNCNKNDLVSQVLWAQIQKPAKHDWCNVVEEDLEQVGLGHLTIEDFETFGKHKMKALVKKAIRETSYKYLLEQKKTLSKLKKLEYPELKIQEYLCDGNMSNRHKKLTFKIRTRMLKNFKDNFGQKVTCSLCHEENSEDSQQHGLLNCERIKSDCPEINNEPDTKYENIFSENTTKIKETAKLCDISLRKREWLLNH